MKILYIEDNPVDIDLTLRKLKKESPHIQMTTARSQAEALRIIRSPEFSDYDLVLTDMHLQDGDGIAVLSHIRGHSLPVAVVILTGQGDEEAAVAALKAGADDYVIKKKGYLDKIAHVLESALTSYLKAKDMGRQILKVLYVEHNWMDVDLTVRHLERYAPHIQVDNVSSVADFYKILGQPGSLFQYSALLLDYRLPRENALELLKRINLVSNTEIPVIFITGKGDEEIAVKALKLGAFDYVTKNQGYLFKLPSVIENAHYSMRLTREHEALMESEKRYRSLFENNHAVMLLIDPDSGEIIDANAAAIRFYGWTRPELQSKTVYEINTLTRNTLQREIEAVRKKNRSHFHFKHMLADGSVRDVEVHSGPIDVGGRALMYSMIYDITRRIREQREKEQLQKRLIQAQKMESFGQLAGGIAHDFNNMLSAIMGYTELALDEAEKRSSIEDYLQEVYAASKRAKDLVAQILAFARQSDEELKPIQVGAIAKEVLKLIRPSTPTSIEIREDFNTDAFILGNAIQVHQIMMNLCTNAAHAMEKDGGVLEICLADIRIEDNPEFSALKLKPGDYVKLTVSDTGTGIPEEILGAIYEPYFTTKSPGEGTGMGLAMVYGIVENHGGRINVQSEVNKGSVFTLYLPVVEECADHPPYESLDLPGGSENILFVDDEASIAEMNKQILEHLGYSVTTRTDSMEALDLFRKMPAFFDLLITDMTMPTMTGDQLATEIMAIRQDLPVILCTGYSRKISEETAFEIGIRALAYKPIIKADLAKTVRQVLDES